MRLVKRRSDTESLVSSQVGLVVGVFVGYLFLRDTRHLAHFWPIAIVLSILFEASLLFRFERR